MCSIVLCLNKWCHTFYFSSVLLLRFFDVNRSSSVFNSFIVNYMHASYFTCPFINVHLGYFQLFTIIYSAIMNVSECLFEHECFSRAVFFRLFCSFRHNKKCTLH